MPFAECKWAYNTSEIGCKYTLIKPNLWTNYANLSMMMHVTTSYNFSDVIFPRIFQEISVQIWVLQPGTMPAKSLACKNSTNS